jgi:glutathione S-transferase
VQARLLAISGSHPCAAVAAMLEAKGIAYERIDLIPAFSRIWLRMTGFGAGTVPALRLDGRRVQGSCAIARALDAVAPDPPLFPAGPAARAGVERIEKWGDGPFQEATRHIALWAASRAGVDLRFALAGARLQFHAPERLALLVLRPLLRLDAVVAGARDETVRADLAALPGMLDRVDEWIERGEVGGDPPTAADYQLAGSLWLLLAIDDLAPWIAGRPAAGLARRLIAPLPGGIPEGVLRADWLPAQPDAQLGARANPELSVDP